MRLPTTNPITLPFGSTEPPYSARLSHRGTDFGHNPDSTVYAPADGIVTYVPNNGMDGNALYYTAEGVQIGLLHLSKSFVGTGTTVKAGQPIGIMGETGAAQGVHLHWAVKKNGQYIDPMSLIKGDNVDNLTEAQYDTLAREILTGYMFMAVDGSDPDRQPTKQEVTDTINGLKADPIGHLQYLRNTAPWGANWNRVKHYPEDVANGGSFEQIGEINGQPIFGRKG